MLADVVFAPRERRHARQIPAGRFAHGNDSIRIQTVLRAVCAQEAHGGADILDRRGERIHGRGAIIDARHRVAGFGKIDHRGQPDVSVHLRKRAAARPDDHGELLAEFRLLGQQKIEIQRSCRRAVPVGDGLIGNAADLRDYVFAQAGLNDFSHMIHLILSRRRWSCP